jgi:hypothetical protein
LEKVEISGKKKNFWGCEKSVKFGNCRKIRGKFANCRKKTKISSFRKTFQVSKNQDNAKILSGSKTIPTFQTHQ